VIEDLDIEVETNWTSSVRPKWLVTFTKGFCFQKQKIPIRGGKPRIVIALVEGPFCVSKIEHLIGPRGDFQRIYLKPKGWDCKWSRSEDVLPE